MRKQKSIRWFRYTVEDAKAAQAELDEQALRDAINATGYQAGRVDKEPWQKKGLFGRR